MKLKTVVISLTVAGVLSAGGYNLYMMGMRRGMDLSDSAATASTLLSGATSNAAMEDPSTWTISKGEAATRRHIKNTIKAGDIDPITGRKILYYHDPMVPGKKFQAPGKSPFMDMMLVPAYVGSEGADASTITVSARIQQNIGLRTTPVVEGTLGPQVSTVGSIAYNERDQAIVQARAMGYVEKLHVRATLDRVTKDQPLVDIYVPDWVAAQEEFLSVSRMQGTGLAPLIEGARARMRQAGMDETHIQLVESTGRVQPRLTIRAPIGGVAAELMVREGMTVMPGMTLARINGLETVWANAEVPESQASLLRPGAKVIAMSPAVPGATFEGRVQALLPVVDQDTRTLKARMEIVNPTERLVPGMFVQMNFMDKRESKVVLIPTEAVIQTGKRAVVMLAEEDGKFRPVEVVIGIEAGGQTEIKRGLSAGQKVVLSGQFLIDSEASLKGVEARLDGEITGQPGKVDMTETHHTTARIESIDSDTVTLQHAPIPSLGWSAMKMDFLLPRDELSRSLSAGDHVEIEFRMQDGDVPRITSIQRATPNATISMGGKP